MVHYEETSHGYENWRLMPDKAVSSVFFFYFFDRYMLVTSSFSLLLLLNPLIEQFLLTIHYDQDVRLSLSCSLTRWTLERILSPHVTRLRMMSILPSIMKMAALPVTVFFKKLPLRLKFELFRVYSFKCTWMKILPQISPPLSHKALSDCLYKLGNLFNSEQL